MHWTFELVTIRQSQSQVVGREVRLSCNECIYKISIVFVYLLQRYSFVKSSHINSKTNRYILYPFVFPSITISSVISSSCSSYHNIKITMQSSLNWIASASSTLASSSSFPFLCHVFLLNLFEENFKKCYVCMYVRFQSKFYASQY
jgi:hypothetical protein